MTDMAGLGKGLKREDQTVIEAKAENFIKGASERADDLKQAKKTKGRSYKTYTFSLTEAVSMDIDKLSFMPKDFRASRSDIVKAGIETLKRLPEDQLIELIKEIK